VVKERCQGEHSSSKDERSGAEISKRDKVITPRKGVQTEGEVRSKRENQKHRVLVVR